MPALDNRTRIPETGDVFTMSRLAGYSRILIGRYRRMLPVRWLGETASFVSSAYQNEGSDIVHNGEAWLLRATAAAGFHVGMDVGANFGSWVSLAARNWPACRFHAFEVAQPTFQRLSMNLGSAGLSSRVTLNCSGLSDHRHREDIFYYPEHPEVTSDRHRHPDNNVIRLPATFQAGDDYIVQAGIDRIDFLKIDVEGSEYKVLKGFERALQSNTIHCIQFEYGAFSIDTRILLRDYYALLGDKYWIGKIYPSYVEFLEYDWRMEDFRFANYCCVLRSRPDLRRLLET